MGDARVEARGVTKDYPRAGASGGVLTAVRPLESTKIGRASCRERV